MNILEEQTVACPYCGEAISLLVDCSLGDHDYIEDCQVCCRPMLVAVHIDGAVIQVQVRHEND